MLHCLNGEEWLSSLDLKSGYWQVEMEEDSKALTASTVGPLGFYECECMPFGLTNAPAFASMVDAKPFGQFTFMLLHYLS